MKKLAFTLVELLVVITIIGVLSLVIAFAIRQTSLNAKIARKDADLKSILTAIESKRAENVKVLKDITVSDNSVDDCLYNGHTPQDATCAARMNTTYTNLGFNKAQIDPWGNIYMIDENEMDPKYGVSSNNLCFKHDELFSINHGNINVPFYICSESEVGIVH